MKPFPLPAFYVLADSAVQNLAHGAPRLLHYLPNLLGNPRGREKVMVFEILDIGG